MKKENKDFTEKQYLSRHVSELSGWWRRGGGSGVCVWHLPGRENRKDKGPEERAGLAFKGQARAG